jgi:hypothetical protein
MSSSDRDPKTEARMALLATELAAAVRRVMSKDLAGKVEDTAGGDVLYYKGRVDDRADKPIDLVLDDDGYVQVSFWTTTADPPAQVAATIEKILAAITAPLLTTR